MIFETKIQLIKNIKGGGAENVRFQKNPVNRTFDKHFWLIYN